MYIKMKPAVYIYLVVLLFLVPLPWLAAWVTAVLFHELCHWAAVRLCGGDVFSLTVGLGGAVMDCSVLPSEKRFISIMSGPVGGLLLLFLGRWLPRVAICSWVLSVYNLLPLLPLDGGRALQILIRHESVFRAVEFAFLLFITFGAIYFSIYLQCSAIPLIVVGILWLKSRKRPCKQSIYKVQ